MNINSQSRNKKIKKPSSVEHFTILTVKYVSVNSEVP